MSIFVYFCLFLYSFNGPFWSIPERRENLENIIIIPKSNIKQNFGATF